MLQSVTSCWHGSRKKNIYELDFFPCVYCSFNPIVYHRKENVFSLIGPFLPFPHNLVQHTRQQRDKKIQFRLFVPVFFYHTMRHLYKYCLRHEDDSNSISNTITLVTVRPYTHMCGTCDKTGWKMKMKKERNFSNIPIGCVPNVYTSTPSTLCIVS